MHQGYAPYPSFPPPPPHPDQRVPQQREPSEPRRDHRWGFGAFLLAEFVFIFTSLLVPLVVIVPAALQDPDVLSDDAPLSAPVLVAALAIPPVVAAVVALIATRVRGNGPVVDLRLRFGWRDVGIGVACGMAGLLITIPAGMLWAYVVGEDEANSAVGEHFDGLNMPVILAVLVFIDVWLLAPVCEEIIFRGLLWGAMERREWNRWLILGLTSVVFALAHLELQRASLLLVIGLPIGVARLLSGRLAAPVIAHQINNFLPALVLMMMLLGQPLDG